MRYKKQTLGIIVIMIIILMCASISAFGVSSRYSRFYPLKMEPGTTKNIQLKLQTTPGSGDLKIKAELVRGNEIARFLDRNIEYDVLVGKHAIVNLEVKLPENTVEGTSQMITLRFVDTTPVGELGTVTFRGASDMSIPVEAYTPPEPEPTEVPQEPAEPGGSWIWWIVALIIIIIVIIVIIIIMKKKKGGAKPGKPVPGKPVKPTPPPIKPVSKPVIGKPVTPMR
jgi:flagellar basal body-associated protein FliL